MRKIPPSTQQNVVLLSPQASLCFSDLFLFLIGSIIVCVYRVQCDIQHMYKLCDNSTRIIGRSILNCLPFSCVENIQTFL